ncbi:glycosyltransferase [Mucilaginibacter sp. SMC90]|uniref:glycosyltransferase n=1 Tax=Mucilaginibacter sp. SMC90 TaxID=2929803 RepID=UPI001FB524E1|nr:glycosyltransferase [Mucilaginibacter sp. SMC90]UOE48193.1 glycosyltransferase [Mucilaginibacter sp. SMC90]
MEEIKSFAPIVLFVYNRPAHSLKTLEALNLNDYAADSKLYIYADGPKAQSTPETVKAIEETRKVIKQKQWCKEVVIIEAEVNKGLADSIVEGVSRVVNEHGKVIVLEDDIVTTKGFLKYMNDALTVYEQEEKVMHISGYLYPAKINDEQKGDTFFINTFSCWGWATWARAWKFYNPNVDDHLSKLNYRAAIKKFNIEGHADYYNQLVLNKKKTIYTWAVKWYASWLFQNGFSLFPRKSLVLNIGYDNSGVHSAGKDIYVNEIADYIEVKKQPIVENFVARKAIDTFYHENNPLVKTALFNFKIKIIVFLKKAGIFYKLRDIYRKLSK